MNLNRIRALIQYDWLTIRKSKWRMIEMLYFPFASMLLWGFFTLYARAFALETALIILTVQIYWHFADLSQRSVSLQMMDDIWTRSLKELLISPLRTIEYLVGRIIFSVLRASLTFLVLVIGALLLFNLNLFANPVFLLMILSVMFVASIGLAILVSSVILILGREYGFLAWSLTAGLFFLSAPFYPLSVFPIELQVVARAIPYAWIFELIKNFVATGLVNMSAVVNAYAISLFYFIISFPIFFRIFERARKKGKLVKLWA